MNIELIVRNFFSNKTFFIKSFGELNHTMELFLIENL